MFQGFSEKTPDFFWQLRFNNERAWFQAHRTEFDTDVQQPLRALSDELFDFFQENWPALHMNVHASRIYRDARRLFGRGPFKDHLWISFQEGEQWNNVPCFYFEVGAETWGYGMGCWTGEAGLGRRFRRAVDRDPRTLERLLHGLQAHPELRIVGERYAKSRGHAGEAIEAWYNMKNWSICCDMPYDACAYTHDLADAVKAGFRFLMPYYQYLMKYYLSAE